MSLSSSSTGPAASGGRSHDLERIDPAATFVPRHLGPRDRDIEEMLAVVGCGSLEALCDETVPSDIRLKKPLAIGPSRTEADVLRELAGHAAQNRVMRSMIGMGYYDCITPPVILRNILENPGWYTQYTPYQAEISQGRLEALLNFQTMVADLTGLPLANASLLDEATAAAEAMHVCRSIVGESQERNVFFVAADCHPQTIAVVKTRAQPLGIEVATGDPADFFRSKDAVRMKSLFGLLLQYPTTDGRIEDYRGLTAWAHEFGVPVVAATDLLACALIEPPGEWGADIAVGSAQRFGVPMGLGGPHAAFLATKDEYKRLIPGRIIGVSKDAHGRPAYRLAIQTREQHIRREKATSNICTAQALLAIVASMYAVYHGPTGLRRIAHGIHGMAARLREQLAALGYYLPASRFFDTITIHLDDQRYYTGSPATLVDAAAKAGINLRATSAVNVSISLDEATTEDDITRLVDALASVAKSSARGSAISPYKATSAELPQRTSAYLTHPVFCSYHSETEMLRYMKRLENRDLSLAHAMIPLGSCTMKLNATCEMIPVTWPAFGALHPFAPADQWRGYQALFEQLEAWLAEITGFAKVSLQPNAGSQGEYTGLLVIRAYHRERGQVNRDVCLIPESAHGTNPASAVVAGFTVVPVACDAAGNIDVENLRAKAAEHTDRLGALMVTYPSTHGVFETAIREICDIVHQHGGLVYMDGANMNAQVGLCRPGDIGADVCHLNLHKTFCIPHGGGGPGMGPICVTASLAPYLPSHPVLRPDSAGEKAIGAVAAAPYGSPSILPISWVYIAAMGGEGLTRATQVAILNANYMARRLEKHYTVLYRGRTGRVAHEFILDCRPFEKTAGVKVEDIAKRLIDFGFHAPTMSFPVPGTLMIEPTESESRQELDRFCEAMIAIREEIRAIENGAMPRDDNPLKGAPHTAEAVARDDWPHTYPREQAAYPLPWVRNHKFWPAVGRIDNAYGDRNLFCTCPPVSAG
ncbi:MAG: glycine dehydrogenase (decarboxylating) [Phycisphaerae bacterium]|nr:MAG: aminomethyl-transferring glycine dehydrogenase [Planctomycetia bacterium]RIK66727.1 MAG: glycine dehydrogenase (aminomethyl-transferring) [Planctomycetota bacterium]GJQ25239.1 MAG: glycine dehydrogenase (decarboxylating) [Phycisphaerae bacterium]